MRTLLLILATLLATPATAEPALWMVQGKTGAVYLFGTMHIVPKKSEWFTPRIKTAFDHSQALWEEADVGLSDPTKMESLMALGMAPDTDVFALLPANYSALLKAQLAKCGMPDMVVAHLKPWLAGMMPTVCALMGADHADPSTMLGPESTLLDAAKTAGKEQGFFETAEQQIGYLAGGSEHSQILQLEQAIDEAAGDEKSELGVMEDAWLSGDEKGMRVEIDKLQKTDPETYQTIFVKRNKNFATAIAGMVTGGKNVFVAIGAGHLIGPDSVVAMLGKMGVTARRI
jgi:uncharacterized protein YbaP (TraB family)